MSILSLHPLVQRDPREILDYYELKSGGPLADRFFKEAEQIVEKIRVNPEYFHPIDTIRRRADFPYHFVYEIQLTKTRITILRHNKRNPYFGLRRK